MVFRFTENGPHLVTRRVEVHPRHNRLCFALIPLTSSLFTDEPTLSTFLEWQPFGNRGEAPVLELGKVPVPLLCSRPLRYPRGGVVIGLT